MLDEGSGDDGAGVSNDAGTSDNVEFELDLDADPSTGDSSLTQDAGSIGAGSPPAPTTAESDRLAALERSNAELKHYFLGLATGRTPQTPGKPPVTRERLLNDPKAGPEDLLEYIEGTLSERSQQLQAQAEWTARNAASEQRARGLFNAREMGTGRDFDSMIGRHVNPLVQINPGMEHLIASVFPNDPAVGKYAVACFQEIGQRLGTDDPVRILKSMLNSLDAHSAGRKEVARQIARNATDRATRVFSGAESGRTRGVRKVQDINDLSDKEFDRFVGQITQ